MGTEEEALVVITDPDKNTDERVQDLLSVQVSSSSDRSGFPVSLNEAGNNTGLFRGTFGFSTDISDPARVLLKVADGDTVSIVYEETRPPATHEIYVIWYASAPDTVQIGVEEEATQDGSGLPENYTLKQNYPNPFNSVTVIPYKILRQSCVRLVIYDITGRMVKTLVLVVHAPGNYQARWDGTDNSGQPSASGQYIVRLYVDEEEKKSIKLMYIR